MIHIKGIYTDAVIYTDNIEETALQQIQQMCDLPFLKDAKIRIMPDVHAGAGCTIGTTMTIQDAIVPNFVGVDIGCGMEVVQITEKEIDYQKLDEVIHQFIPAGFNIRNTPHPNIEHTHLDELYCREAVDMSRARLSLGTLGGGNHFIELDQDDEGNYYLVIHSGSRHAGCQVADYYQNEAFLSQHHATKEDVKEKIREYKEAGREAEIQSMLETLKKDLKNNEDKKFAYVSGELMDMYLHDMGIMQEYAMYNRKTMSSIIVEKMHWTVKDSFTTIHNYIDLEHMILRKGSVSAQKEERLIIPINMKDGSLICTGKGNPEWNASAPHGAGRILSRAKAKQEFNLQTYQKEMEGIYTTSVSLDTIDEAPMAYKPMDEIIQNVQDTVTIEKIIRPVYNFKAG